MQHLDLNQFMTDVHRNAIAHGWWDKPRTDGTIRSLFHCELSEAVESYRKSEPLHYHLCPGSACACEEQPVHEMENLHCEACTPADRKPEGGAVELMDFVIRVLDYLGKSGEKLHETVDTPRKMADRALDDICPEGVEDVTALDLPDLADALHTAVALSDVMRNTDYLITACGIAMAWVERQGVDPAEVLTDKHHYNLTRPYKHGGKVC